MRRIRLRAALLVVVAAALGGIGYLVSRSVMARRTDMVSALGKDLLPHVAQRIQNFRRMKVEDGRNVWQITARDAQFLKETNEILVREPEMRFFLDEQAREALVRGAEGRILLAGSELRSITLRGEVVVRLDDLELRTAEATYDRASDLITSRARVTIRGRRLEVEGRGMEVEVTPQQMRLLEDVHTVMHADAAPS
jgi:LPS export ABC transporter protein LptC